MYSIRMKLTLMSHRPFPQSKWKGQEVSSSISRKPSKGLNLFIRELKFPPCGLPSPVLARCQLNGEGTFSVRFSPYNSLPLGFNSKQFKYL